MFTGLRQPEEFRCKIRNKERNSESCSLEGRRLRQHCWKTDDVQTNPKGRRFYMGAANQREL